MILTKLQRMTLLSKLTNAEVKGAADAMLVTGLLTALRGDWPRAHQIGLDEMDEPSGSIELTPELKQCLALKIDGFLAGSIKTAEGKAMIATGQDASLLWPLVAQLR